MRMDTPLSVEIHIHLNEKYQKLYTDRHEFNILTLASNTLYVQDAMDFRMELPHRYSRFLRQVTLHTVGSGLDLKYVLF